MRILVSLLFFTWLAPFAAAQSGDPESIFDSYDHMRSFMDEHLKNRDIVRVMRAFGASDEMTSEDLASLQQRVLSIFPEDFRNVDVLRRNDMGNGWRQELYVYWTGMRYLYAYVLMHDQGRRLIAVHFQFNTDFLELNENF